MTYTKLHPRTERVLQFMNAFPWLMGAFMLGLFALFGLLSNSGPRLFSILMLAIVGAVVLLSLYITRKMRGSVVGILTLDDDALVQQFAEFSTVIPYEEIDTVFLQRRGDQLINARIDFQSRQIALGMYAELEMIWEMLRSRVPDSAEIIDSNNPPPVPFTMKAKVGFTTTLGSFLLMFIAFFWRGFELLETDILNILTVLTLGGALSNYPKKSRSLDRFMRVAAIVALLTLAYLFVTSPPPLLARSSHCSIWNRFGNSCIDFHHDVDEPIAFSSNNTYLFGTSSGNIRERTIRRSGFVRSSVVMRDRVYGAEPKNGITVSPYGRFIAFNDRDNLYIANRASGEVIWQAPDSYWNRHPQFSNDGNLLLHRITNDLGSDALLSTDTFEVQHELPFRATGYWLSPNSPHIFYVIDEKMVKYDFQSDTIVSEFKIEHDLTYPQALSLSANGTRMALLENRNVAVYDIATGQKIWGRVIGKAHSSSLELALAPDGQALYIVSDEPVPVQYDLIFSNADKLTLVGWSLPDGEEIVRNELITDTSADLKALDISPDGKIIAVTTRGGLILLDAPLPR